MKIKNKKINPLKFKFERLGNNTAEIQTKTS